MNHSTKNSNQKSGHVDKGKFLLFQNVKNKKIVGLGKTI